MYFDYWHIRRYLTLATMDSEEELPFGEPPIVLGSVISLPEPVWKTVINTLLAHDTASIFQNWAQQRSLPVDSVEIALSSLHATIADIRATGVVCHPPDLAKEDRIDTESVLIALQALHDLLTFARERNSAVNTWAE